MEKADLSNWSIETSCTCQGELNVNKINNIRNWKIRSIEHYGPLNKKRYLCYLQAGDTGSYSRSNNGCRGTDGQPSDLLSRSYDLETRGRDEGRLY